MKNEPGAKNRRVSFQLRWAKRIWVNQITKILISQLKELLETQNLSVLSGDLTLLNGKWYVTHSGLLRLGMRHHCNGIRTQAIHELCDRTASRWAFRAIVFKSRACRGFVGYGDADPSNVSPLVHGAELRIAETRAVNRALRKAYGMGICSVEEIGSGITPAAQGDSKVAMALEKTNGGNGHNKNGNGSRVRDRLCQLIRSQRLDAALVKAYAIDFCGTKTLREASREQVEGFIVHLADWVEKDRNALLCQLNSYAHLQPQSGVA